MWFVIKVFKRCAIPAQIFVKPLCNFFSLHETLFLRGDLERDVKILVSFYDSVKSAWNRRRVTANRA